MTQMSKGRATTHSFTRFGRSYIRLLLILFPLVSMLTSCTHFVEPPRLEPGKPETAHAAWARVLETVVDDTGRINFAHLARDPHDLYVYLDYVARVSPSSDPEKFLTKADKLAYYINSYNALAMYGVIAYGVPDDFSSLLDRDQFFKFTEYRVGGRSISLDDYENDVIRPLGDPRVHFALNSMSVGSPRLPRTPFRTAHLNDQLDAAAREFLNSKKYVQVDFSRHVARLPEILDSYSEDFANEKHSPSLLAYVNRYRRERIPEDFEVEFMPCNWAVAKQ